MSNSAWKCFLPSRYLLFTTCKKEYSILNRGVLRAVFWGCHDSSGVQRFEVQIAIIFDVKLPTLDLQIDLDIPTTSIRKPSAGGSRGKV